MTQIFLAFAEADKNLIRKGITLGIDKLIKELQQEAVDYQRHKVLLVKALKWLEQNRNPSILLRGYNLEQYQSWLELASSRTVNLPTDLQI